MDKPQRLFFALWPDQVASEQLAQLSKTLFGGHHRLKLVVPANIHLTLVFLGASSQEQRRCYAQAADRIATAPFELVFDRIRFRRRQHMVWLEASQTPEPLKVLLTQLTTGLIDCGHQAEQRPFRPHITLARKVRETITEAAVVPIIWQVHEFQLVQSKTHPEGAQYQIEHRWSLSNN